MRSESDMNVFQAIKQETKNFSGKTAVIEGDNRISYGKLLSSAEEIASALKGKGVMPFHRVGLLCGDSIDYIATSLAVLSLSAVVVPISQGQTETEIASILDRIAVNFLVFEKDHTKMRALRPFNQKAFIKRIFYQGKRDYGRTL